MNSAPAELLQLLTIAALQPSSSHRATTKIGISQSIYKPDSHLAIAPTQNKKAAMPDLLQAVRLAVGGEVRCISV
jgi:hypothetical protein